MQLHANKQLRPGIHFPEGGKPVAICWSPYARVLELEVEGRGSFVFCKLADGYWSCECLVLKPGDRYFFRINGRKSFPDPASLSQPDGVHGPSEAVDLEELRKLRLEGYKGLALADLVIYELHTGTFSPEGTFAGITKKLPYLKSLGVNAIEIMPVASFPGNRNWGYDGVFPYAVQHTYGGPKGLAGLVKACHEQGMAVILDVVYNHIGPEGNYLGRFGPYFSRKHKTPWGQGLNFDGEDSKAVRHYFLENALMWLHDFDIDGLRLDAIHAIVDNSPKHFLQELSQEVQQLNAETGRNHFLIGESDLNDPMIFMPTRAGGYGLESQWCDDWHHALHAKLTGERMGYYIDFGPMEQLVKSFNHAFVYDGIYSKYRKKIFGTSAGVGQGERFVVFTQNHDQTGNRMLGDRLSTLVDFESLKIAAAALLFSPFVPMLFMGEEFGEESPFLFFTSHGSERLAEQVRRGRKREYRAFLKDVEPPDPQAEETFLRSKLKWDFSKNRQKESLLAFYKKCIQLRKEIALFRPGSRRNFRATQMGEGAMLLVRKGEKETLLAVFNFYEKPFSVVIKELISQQSDLLLYSAHKQWGGSMNDSHDPMESSSGKTPKINLEPRSVAVFFFRLP
jgi:maltooligosyltrehalose trehalohydrolase